MPILEPQRSGRTKPSSLKETFYGWIAIKIMKISKLLVPLVNVSIKCVLNIPTVRIPRGCIPRGSPTAVALYREKLASKDVRSTLLFSILCQRVCRHQRTTQDTYSPSIKITPVTNSLGPALKLEFLEILPTVTQRSKEANVEGKKKTIWQSRKKEVKTDKDCKF